LPDLLNRRIQTRSAKPATLAKDDEALQNFVSFTSSSPVGHDENDGLKITLADESTIHIHPSGNAAELRCYTEAVSADQALHLLSNSRKKIQDALCTRP
jgi:phosphomannomutase